MFENILSDPCDYWENQNQFTESKGQYKVAVLKIEVNIIHLFLSVSLNDKIQQAPPMWGIAPIEKC